MTLFLLFFSVVMFIVGLYIGEKSTHREVARLLEAEERYIRNQPPFPLEEERDRAIHLLREMRRYFMGWRNLPTRSTRLFWLEDREFQNGPQAPKGWEKIDS